jgi:hypothetical protein
MDPCVAIGLAIAAIALIAWVSDLAHKASLYTSLKPRLDTLEQNEASFARRKMDAEQKLRRDQEALHQLRTSTEARLQQDRLEAEQKRRRDEQAINQLAAEKSLGFPWLAEAYAQYFQLRDNAVAAYLERKPRPAAKAADHIRSIAAERRRAEKLWRVLNYQITYYEALFPWLVEFKGEELDDLVRQLTQPQAAATTADEAQDPVRHWLTAAEYRDLSTAQKNQLALDRYWQKKKPPWELGRDYERFIGHEYESKGWQVAYQGIIEGLADLGRDLIAQRGSKTQVVQCKYWSKHKTIHEKHIFQLFGTVVAYRIDHPDSHTSGVFVTSTQLSDRARQFAAALTISCRESVPLASYPSIKCNVARRDGSKIYHLPIDQQYDRTLVEEERNECYVTTVAEAEHMGFRRAFRWRGSATTSAK